MDNVKIEIAIPTELKEQIYSAMVRDFSFNQEVLSHETLFVMKRFLEKMEEEVARAFKVSIND